jgi:hypothetical protein
MDGAVGNWDNGIIIIKGGLATQPVNFLLVVRIINRYS